MSLADGRFTPSKGVDVDPACPNGFSLRFRPVEATIKSLLLAAHPEAVAVLE